MLIANNFLQCLIVLCTLSYSPVYTHAFILLVFANYDEVFGIFECFSVVASSVILILICHWQFVTRKQRFYVDSVTTRGNILIKVSI